jgi:hypothetical protein
LPTGRPVRYADPDLMSGVREGSGTEQLRDAERVWDLLETSFPTLFARWFPSVIAFHLPLREP